MAARISEYYENDLNDQDFSIKLLRNRNQIVNCSGVNETDYFDFKQIFGNDRLAEFEPQRHFDFPTHLRNQLNKSQSHISMGLFATVGRAWMSIDSDLFFWRFDTNDDLAYFDIIQDTITHVQLVRPKHQYTDPKVHFIVVVVTSTEILLFGMGFNNQDRIPIMRDSPVNYLESEMLIFAEPLFKTTLDCGAVQHVIGTKEGRIFFAGQDSLYELTYQTGGWFRGTKCDKLNHSKGYMANFLPAISFLTTVEEIKQIAVDDTRHFLFTLGDKSTIQLYDLGSDGLGFEKRKIVSLLDIQREIRSSCGVEDDYLAGIANIRAIPSTRSHYACLEAVTTKGLRVYFAACNVPLQHYLFEQEKARSETLRVIHIRYPPSENFGFNRNINIYAAHGDHESLTLGHMINDDESAISIFSGSSFQYSNFFMENVTDFQFNGSIWSIAKLPVPPVPSSPPHIVPMLEAPWIVRQHAQLFQQLYILTSEGIYVFQQSSPLEIFRRIITLFECDSRQFHLFLDWHGRIEVCIMALCVLATNLADDPQIENTAVRVLVEFGGFPRIQIAEDHDRSIYSPVANQTIANVSQFQSPLRASTPYGQVNDENMPIAFEQIKPSDRHEALYTYFARIVSCIWNTRLCIRQNNVAFNALPMGEVDEVIRLTGSLLAAIEKFNLLTYNNDSKIYDQETVRAYEEEQKSLAEYKKIVTFTHEFLNLWKILDEHQFHVLTQLLPDEFFSGLGNMSLSTLIPRCKENSAEFVTAIVKHYIGDEATTAVISQRLSDECPSLFTPQDAHILKASEYIATAKNLSMGSFERQKAVQSAVDILRTCVRRVNMGLICDLLKQINAYDSIADLALERAEKEDPTKVAIIAYRESIVQYEPRIRDAIARRNECYQHIENALDYLHTHIGRGGSPEISVPFAVKQRDGIIKKVLDSEDELAQVNLFQWMLRNGMEDKLLHQQQRFFEQFLCHQIEQGAGEKYLQLLWKYYEKNANYISAAKLLLSYSEKSTKLDLNLRLTYLSHALLCIQSAPETRDNQELKQRIQEFLDVVQIQQTTRDEIEKCRGIRLNDQDANAALELLNSKVFTLTELFREFAEEYRLPKIKLAILNCANHFEADAIERIWEEILKQDFENANDANTIRARIIETLSKLYRLYGSSQDYVPIEFILHKLLLHAIKIDAPASWLPTICKESGITLAALLHVVGNEVRQDPFFCQPRELQYIVNMGKYTFEQFILTQSKMNYTERAVLKEKCLSFIGTLEFNEEDSRGQRTPVSELKMYEKEIKQL